MDVSVLMTDSSNIMFININFFLTLKCLESTFFGSRSVSWETLFQLIVVFGQLFSSISISLYYV